MRTTLVTKQTASFAIALDASYLYFYGAPTGNVPTIYRIRR